MSCLLSNIRPARIDAHRWPIKTSPEKVIEGPVIVTSRVATLTAVSHCLGCQSTESRSIRRNNTCCTLWLFDRSIVRQRRRIALLFIAQPSTTKLSILRTRPSFSHPTSDAEMGE